MTTTRAASGDYARHYRLSPRPVFRAADCGCYLDRANGWHNDYGVIELAVGYGFTLADADRDTVGQYKRDGPRASDDDNERILAIADAAVEYLQSRQTASGGRGTVAGFA